MSSPPPVPAASSGAAASTGAAGPLGRVPAPALFVFSGLTQYLGAAIAVGLFVLSSLLFTLGILAMVARRNAVGVLIGIELVLNAVNINLIAFGAYNQDIAGQVFALFIIAVAAAEVGVGLAIVLLIYRNRRSIDVSEADLLKG